VTSTIGAYLPDVAASLASAYRASGKSERTIEQYTAVLRGFSRFLIDLGRSDDPDLVTATDVEDWVVYNRATRSPITAKSYYLALKSIWGWMRRRGITTSDPFRGVETPQADERVIRILTDDEVRAILAQTEGSTFLARRDRAMILLACDSGLRRSEIAAARLDDLDLATGRLILRGTKAGRDRIAPLSDKTRMEMRRYLKERERVVAGKVDPATLFVSRTGARLSGFAVHGVFASRARGAMVDVDRPVHAFRAWFACKALESGANESAVMHIAGWRQSDMLRRYTRGRAAELALTAHRAFSPVSGL
jgi:site-specific recombinase XerD